MRDIHILLDGICEAFELALLPHGPYRPHGGKTFCNFVVNYVCKKMGCDDFMNSRGEPMLANRMVKYMKDNKTRWMPIDMGAAQIYANQGSLVLAGQENKPHGHVCIVRPGISTFSGKWGRNAPKVMNVGADVFISKGVNFAFKEEPWFWVWALSL